MIRKLSGLVWFFVFLILFEILVARNLGFYGLAPTSSVGQISYLLDIFAEQDREKIRWLIVGDSQSRDAIRPQLVAEELGDSTESIFNLSINAGKPEDFAYLLSRTVPQMPNLQGIIINVNEHYFDRKDVQYDPKFRFLASLGERMMVPGPERKADLLLSRLFYTYGMHLQWWEIIKMSGEGRRSVKSIQATDGLPPVTDETEEKKSEKYAQELSTSWLLDFRPIGPQTSALERTLSYLDQRNINCVLIYLPKTQLIKGIMNTKYHRQEQQFFDYIDTLSTQHQIKFHRNFIGITDDCFRDVNHMNEKGAEKIAPQIAGILRGM